MSQNISNMLGRVSLKNAAHSSSAAAATAHNDANNLAKLFGSMRVGRHHNPYGKSTRKKKPMSGHMNFEHSRATRSAVKSGRASLGPALQNAKKKSIRAVKMAVNAANQAQQAASLAAEASAQVQAAQAASMHQPIAFPNFNQHSAAMFHAYSRNMGPSHYKKASTRRKKHGHRRFH